VVVWNTLPIPVRFDVTGAFVIKLSG